MNASSFAKPLLALLDNSFDSAIECSSLCRSLYSTRQYHRLIQYFEEQINPQQKDITMQYLYLKSLLKVFKHEEAESYIKSLNPDLQINSKILYILGLCKIKSVEYQNASSLLISSFKADPTFFEPLYKLLSHHLISEASFTELFEDIDISNEYRDALKSYASLFWFFSPDQKASFAITSKILESNPSSSSAITIYVSHCLALSKRQELFSVAQKLLSIAPDSYLSAFAAAAHLSLINRTETARRLLWYSLQLSPSFAPSWLMYAISYWYDGDSRSALGVIQVAARAFPELELLHLWAGKLSVECGDFEVALAHYQICSKSSYVLNEMGCILLRMNKMEEAVSLFDQAVQKEENNSSYMLNAALAHRRLGDFDTAIGLYMDIEQREPENVQCQLGLGFTFHLMEENNAAYERYRTVLSIDPKNAFAREMIEDVTLKMASDDIFADLEIDDDSDIKIDEAFSNWMKNNQ